MEKEFDKFSPFRLTLDGHPPSVNHTYGRNARRVFKNTKAVKWERYAIDMVMRAARVRFGRSDLSEFKGHPVSLTLEFHRPKWTGKSGIKKGLYVRPDISNFVKIAEDAIFRALSLDDSAVVDLTLRKVESESVRTFIDFRFVG